MTPGDRAPSPAPDWRTAATRLAGLAGVFAGWRPDEFWRATPAELATLVGALVPAAADTPPDPATIARLKREFPDEQ